MRSVFLLYAAVTVSAALTGCRSRAIDARAAEQLSDVRTTAGQQAAYASCPQRGTIGANCGLILKRVSTGDFRDRFRDAKCVGLDDDQCQVLYQRSVDAWLTSRYFLADFSRVEAECDRTPGRCDDPVVHEQIMLDLHNKEIRANEAAAESEIEHHRRHAQALHIDAQLGALR